MLSNIVTTVRAMRHGFSTERVSEKILLIVITSDRGLAGAYNSNIIKAAKALIRKNTAASFKKEMYPSGISEKRL